MLFMSECLFKIPSVALCMVCAWFVHGLPYVHGLCMVHGLPYVVCAWFKLFVHGLSYVAFRDQRLFAVPSM